LYFGSFDGKVRVADVGTTDDGVEVDFDFLQSWQEFDSTSRKKFNMAQVTIESDAPPDILVDINVDFAKVEPKSRPNFGAQAIASPWNTSPWNTSPWSSSETFYVKSFGLADTGYVGALRYRGKLKNSTHTLYGFRIAYEEGEFI
jgi:hypothetical protein